MDVTEALRSAAGHLEARTLAGALALPQPVQRALAGRPVVLDGQTLHPEAQLLLRLKRVAREPGAETLPIPEGREVIRRQARVTAGRLPVGEVSDLEVAGLPARLYVPTGATERSALLVFLHGGGFMYGDLDSHDGPCRYLAEQAGVRVLAIDYRLAPEHPFPAAYDDCLAAYEWVVDHADEVGADPARLAVGGDSAGGNLAAEVSLEAARHGWPLAFQLLVYPATDNVRSYRSAELFGRDFFLTTGFMELATRSYLGPDGDLRDPRSSPLYADVPDKVAPAYVASAGFDPLRDEGEAYARKLAAAGVDVELKRFPDLFHGFFSVVGVGRRARAANAEIAAALRAGVRR